MRMLFPALLLTILPCFLYAQPDHSSFDTQQKLEELSRRSDAEQEDDSYVQNLQSLLKHPLNLNTASREDLEELIVLDEVQITQFLLYRRLLGKLISLYELQAIPGWSLQAIRSVLPYVGLSGPRPAETLQQRFSGGSPSLLLRWGRTLEKAAGYRTAPDSTRHYLGSPDKFYLRYQYRYQQLLQWGLLGEKDAGEPFFKGNQRGFDFYSFHFFARKMGIVRELALGDFTVSTGQGLIQWQGLALGMGADQLAGERQSRVLRPYSSPGESSFQRGIGITIGKKNWELTGYYSRQRISAHLEKDTVGQLTITSLLEAGYHRTAGELDTKNNARLVSAGAVLGYSTGQLQLALNAVQYTFSQPLQKRDEPYNLFAPRGRKFANGSISYAYSHRNLHVFGEAAVDKYLHRAFINGLLLALHSSLDLSVIHRSLARDYGSLFGSAFTQNGLPANESGLYTGITFRAFDPVKIDAFLDVFRFPWLKYRVDAPSGGKEYSVQMTYTPAKTFTLVSRFRREYKPQNKTGPDSIMSAVETIRRTNWRLQVSTVLNKTWTLENRCETNWVQGKADQQGYLLYTGLSCTPARSPVSGNARIQYFDTDGYDTRLYAYESNVLYGFSIPAFFDRGFRYYLNMRIDLSACLSRRPGFNLNCWLRWAQSVYPEKTSLGQGNDAIKGSRKSELTLQLILQ